MELPKLAILFLTYKRVITMNYADVEKFVF